MIISGFAISSNLVFYTNIIKFIFLLVNSFFKINAFYAKIAQNRYDFFIVPLYKINLSVLGIIGIKRIILRLFIC